MQLNSHKHCPQHAISQKIYNLTQSYPILPDLTKVRFAKIGKIGKIVRPGCSNLTPGWPSREPPPRAFEARASHPRPGRQRQPGNAQAPDHLSNASFAKMPYFPMLFTMAKNANDEKNDVFRPGFRVDKFCQFLSFSFNANDFRYKRLPLAINR
jgi:hypothetical protein